MVFSGEARAAFCPCAEPPLTFLAAGGRLEPPGDLFLRFPRVAVAGVPIVALPWLWLRAPDQVGLLPPLFAVRGADGALLGSGVHLPWHGANGAVEALDLTAGGYVKGGAELGARLVTAGSDAAVTADLIHGTRIALEARGVVRPEAQPSVGVAWTLDAVRGDRARSGTVDLSAAAQPFDTAAAELSRRAEAGPVSLVIAAGAVARALRGEGPLAAGPRAALALGGALGGLGSWSADAAGVVLGDGAGPLVQAFALGRASAGAEIDARPGPFELRAAARARARFAGDGDSSEAAAATRVDVELPFARTFPVAGEAPLVHWITPSLSVRGAVAEQRGPFFVPLGGAVPGASWIAAAGISTALGRYAGPALRLDARAGATGGVAEGARGLLHARLGVDTRLAAAAIEAAAVGEQAGAPREPTSASPRSAALLGRVRVGAAEGPWLRLDAAAQTGLAAGQARAVASGAWAALPGDGLAYLAAPGWTGGAEASVPWTRAVRTAARADVDLAAGSLLAVRGLAEYRHPCGCFSLGLAAAHRVGRDGVDVALSVDVVPAARGASPR